MPLYNPLSCSGFITEGVQKIGFNFGSCMGARLGFVGLFFINAFVRKWGGEEIGVDYNFWGGLIGAFIAYLLPLIFTGNVKIALLIGLVGMAIGGYGSGFLFGGGGEDDYGFE